MEYVLVLLYIMLCSVFILRSTWFSSDVINKKQLLLFFLLKVLAGFLYAYIHKSNGWYDSIAFFKGGQYIGKLLPDHPLLFLKLVTGLEPKQLSTEVIEATGISNIPYYRLRNSSFVVQLHGFLHLISFGYYSVHIVLFSFFSFIGLFNICFFLEKNIQFNQLIKYFFVFLLPSILFWVSGAHKDAIIMLGVGITLRAIYEMQQQKLGFVLLLLFGLYISLSVRIYTGALLLPAIFSFVLSSYSKRPLLIFAGIYGLSILAFFTLPFIDERLNFPELFIFIQNTFLSFKGNSNFSMPMLEPTFWSFMKFTPHALMNVFFRPFIQNLHSPFLLFSFLNNMLLILISICCIVFSNTKRFTLKQKRVLYFLLFFWISYSILIGLTVTNTGAMVRYRTTGVVFQLLLLLSILDSNKLKHFFTFKQ